MVVVNDRQSSISAGRNGLPFAEQAGSEGLRLDLCGLLVGRLHLAFRLDEAHQLARREIADPPEDPLVQHRGGIPDRPPFPALVRQAAWLSATMGEPREGLDLLEYQLNLRRLGKPPIGLDDLASEPRGDTRQTLQFAAFCFAALGDADRCGEYVQRLRACHRPGAEPTPRNIADRTTDDLGVHWLRGQWTGVAEAAERLVELFRTTGVIAQRHRLAFLAEALARLGDRDRAREIASRVLASPPTWFNVAETLLCCARALLWSSGPRAKKEVQSAAEASKEFIERTGAKGWLPFVHEVRAQLARVCGDDATCERERTEAERLWTEMGAPGHIERMDRDLEELTARV